MQVHDVAPVDANSARLGVAPISFMVLWMVYASARVWTTTCLSAPPQTTNPPAWHQAAAFFTKITSASSLCSAMVREVGLRLQLNSLLCLCKAISTAVWMSTSLNGLRMYP